MELEDQIFNQLDFWKFLLRISTAEIDQRNRDFFDMLPLKSTLGPKGDVGAYICWYISRERKVKREIMEQEWTNLIPADIAIVSQRDTLDEM